MNYDRSSSSPTSSTSESRPISNIKLSDVSGKLTEIQCSSLQYKQNVDLVEHVFDFIFVQFQFFLPYFCAEEKPLYGVC